jgi:hypothetical protein
MIQQTLTHASFYKSLIPDSNFPEEPVFALNSASHPARNRQQPSFLKKYVARRRSVATLRLRFQELKRPM